MLHDPARHEPLDAPAWSDDAARAAIERIVRDTEARFSPTTYWPLSPLDADGGPDAPQYDLYGGAAGVILGLHRLQALGAARLSRDYAPFVGALVALNRDWLDAAGFTPADRASYLFGETGILLLAHALHPSTPTADRLAELIASNVDHPARELMWGAPGTMLASWFLHRRTAEPRFAELFRRSAHALASALQWSPEHRCRYWTQDLYGRRTAYLDAVHGFVANALPLIHGRALLDADAWEDLQRCIGQTIRATAIREDERATWPVMLEPGGASGTPGKRLMQYCHGAPGFVVCLAHLPSTELDDLLLAAGEATWAAGPLRKGSNLCHGTGGNGYAFLTLFARTGDAQWLARARAFAMHGLAQVEAHVRDYGRHRYSLWTGDLGFAIYLGDCLRAVPAFPTLDAFVD